jgi:O-acetylserine/cysteine efflux transporter
MEADVTAGLASLILQSQAPITIILAALFFRERVGALQGLGIALACVGLGLFGVAGGGNVTLLGLGLVLCGALSWACGNLVLRRLQGVNTTALFIWASLVPPVPMLGASLATEGAAPLATIAALSIEGWLAVAYVAFISTVLGFSIWGALLSRHRAAAITPFALLIPVVGLSVAALILGETVSRGEAVAGLVVLAGLALSVLGQRSAARRTGRPWQQERDRP